MRTAIVIPARYASSRFPGKPLADIRGRPMIEHVYDRACAVANVASVSVATDDERVAQAVRAFGGDVVMTRADHPSGTDRLVEAMSSIAADLYVNLQGDEPLVRPSDIELLVEMMRSDQQAAVGTLAHPIAADEAANPNAVKVVLSAAGEALYFSRSPIPYARIAAAATYLKHIGIYAYRREALANYSGLARPAIEDAEQLEQLRLLYAGLRIRVAMVQPTGPGVDTAEDLEHVRRILASHDVCSLTP